MPHEEFAELLSEIGQRVSALSNGLPDVIDPAAISLKAKIPYKIIAYRETLLWRTEELSRVAYLQFKNEQVVSGIILTRCVMESAAAVWYVLNRIKTLVENEDLNDFDDKAMRLLMGSKNDTTEINSINIMTFLDKVDTHLSGFRKLYDDLSEFAHPNWAGTSGVYGSVDRSKVLTRLGNFAKEFPYEVGLKGLASSLAVFEYAYSEIGDLMPKVVEISEKGLESN